MAGAPWFAAGYGVRTLGISPTISRLAEKVFHEFLCRGFHVRRGRFAGL